LTLDEWPKEEAKQFAGGVGELVETLKMRGRCWHEESTLKAFGWGFDRRK